MSTAAPSLVTLESSFARDLEGLFVPWHATPPSAPELVVLNEALAEELGIDPASLRTPEGVAFLSGVTEPDGSVPVAQAYAGHQFGSLSPRLGDGRALLLGEVIDTAGRRRDLHLKGSGRTPFARGGDGKAVLGPMLREHLVGEAMHALGIPTTRALAVIATGELVARETLLPGAVLARVASSHLRVGSFVYAAQLEDDLLRRLADHAIARHHPAAVEADEPYLALFEAVLEAQADLVARWMLVGFVHGVMNTDNMTISGETIDYGPCAFMEAFDPATVFSSIDHAGRYAYGNQPAIAQWNLARLAEAMLPLLGSDVDQAVEKATEVLRTFPGRYGSHWEAGMRAKLGLTESDVRADDAALVGDLLQLMHAGGVDLTSGMRSLSAWLRGDETATRRAFGDSPDLGPWVERWQARIHASGTDPQAAAAAMDRVNPVYIPRNHLVEEALAAATGGDLKPYEQLLDAVTRPFEERPGLERHAEPAPPTFCDYRTFCGT